MPRIAGLIRPSSMVCAILVFAAPAAAQALSSKLDPLLQTRTASILGRSRVIVRAPDAGKASLLPILIQQLGGTVGRPLPIIEAVAANVPNAALKMLAASPLVQRLALDRVVRGTMERTSLTVGATAIRQELGLDGSGVGVAIIDSGLAPWHDDLSETGLPASQRVDQFVDFVNGNATRYDDYGHGTHVAGIIAGNGFDAGGMRAGVAPGARLLVLKVLDGSGRGRISNVIAALDYVVSHRAQFNTRVINVSVGAGVFESYDRDLLTLAAKSAVDRGLIVVVSAGNAGRNSQDQTAYGGITAPGNAPWVLTVGASSTQGTVDRGDDQVVRFSSRGPTAVDHRAKPDLVAPGLGIESLSAPQSALFISKSAYLLNGSVPTAHPPYLSLSGTSQAAPVVTGTVALMLQANPALTPNAVKAILQYTAEEYTGYDALTQGAGFLNARGAVELARFFAAPSALPYPSTTTWSRQLLWGNHRLRGGRLSSSASAWGTDATWGSATTSTGEPVTWGIRCSGQDCYDAAPETWGTTCMTPDCSAVVWGDVTAENVVWGWTCGGADCNDVDGASIVWRTGSDLPGSDAWATTADEGDTVVWGTADDGDTVVWGTSSDDDTVVWGTSGDDDTVVWGTSEDDTVVWGTSDDGEVMWKGSGEEPESTTVN
jgi:serine protease AprX